MKFTKPFMDVLRVFSGVSQNMYFREGNIQTSCVATNSGAMVFFVRAKTDVTIEQDFGIGHLGKFCNTLGLFKEPEIEIKDNGSLLISEEGKKAVFRLTNPEFLRYNKEPDKAQLGAPGSTIESALSEAQTVDILSMYGIFDAKLISFIGKDGDFSVTVGSEDTNFSNNGTIVVGKTDEVFKATIKAELFHMPKSAYRVHVSRKGWVYFGNETFEYFIPVEANQSLLR